MMQACVHTLVGGGLDIAKLVRIGPEAVCKVTPRLVALRRFQSAAPFDAAHLTLARARLFRWRSRPRPVVDQSSNLGVRAPNRPNPSQHVGLLAALTPQSQCRASGDLALVRS